MPRSSTVDPLFRVIPPARESTFNSLSEAFSFEPLPGIDINNNEITLGFDLRLCRKIEFQFSDAANGRPWDRASVGVRTLLDFGSAFVWNFDKAYMVLTLVDAATGRIQFADIARQVWLRGAYGIVDTAGAILVPEARELAAAVNVTINGGANTIAGLPVAQVFEGVGAYHLLVDLPPGAMLDGAALAAIPFATVVNALTGEIAVQLPVGAGDLDLPLGFLPVPVPPGLVQITESEMFNVPAGWSIHPALDVDQFGLLTAQFSHNNTGAMFVHQWRNMRDSAGNYIITSVFATGALNQNNTEQQKNVNWGTAVFSCRYNADKNATQLQFYASNGDWLAGTHDVKVRHEWFQ